MLFPIVLLIAAAPTLTIDITRIPRPAASLPMDAHARAIGEKVYSARCAMCHGPQGAGDGPVSASLQPKPRRFSDRFWQSSIDDDSLRQIILAGGTAAKLSPMMPAHPDLKDKPELGALVALIRDMKSKHGTVLVRVEGGETKKSVTVDANDTGSARVQLEVGAGTYTIVVEKVPGVEHCSATAMVADADVTVTCAPALPAP